MFAVRGRIHSYAAAFAARCALGYQVRRSTGEHRGRRWQSSHIHKVCCMAACVHTDIQAPVKSWPSEQTPVPSPGSPIRNVHMFWIPRGASKTYTTHQVVRSLVSRRSLPSTSTQHASSVPHVNSKYMNDMPRPHSLEHGSSALRSNNLTINSIAYHHK